MYVCVRVGMRTCACETVYTSVLLGDSADDRPVR